VSFSEDFIMMDSVESLRKSCLKKQTELRSLLMRSDQFDQALSHFLSHHAMLHSKGVSQTDHQSFADEVLSDIPDEQVRQVHIARDHSIAWLIWHMARCEDIAMNILVAGTPQVLLRGGWLELIKSPVCDTGNAMDVSTLAAFNNAIDLQALRAYRLAVGLRTQEIAKQLQPSDLTRKVEPSRIRQVIEQGAVVDAARGITDYWSKRNTAGLLLMPATRHNLIHLGEVLELKQRFRSVLEKSRSA
jgi:hypothetical protein